MICTKIELDVSGELGAGGQIMRLVSVLALTVAFSTAPLPLGGTSAAYAAPQTEEASPPKKETVSDRDYAKRRAICLRRAKAMKFGVNVIKRIRFINRCMDGKV